MDILKVYLDSCCFNRPFDDLTQPIIHDEADAVKKIIALSEAGKIKNVSSQFVKLAKRFDHKTKVVNPCQFLKEEFSNAT